MTSTQIAEQLSGIPEKDIEKLTELMLSETDRDSKRLLISVIERVNEYAYLYENGITPVGIGYPDFVMGNCPFDMPSPETVEKLRLARVAAENGDAEAEYILAMMYMEGIMGLPDFDSAVKWLRLSAQKGNAAALYELGVCAINGEGMSLDYKAAEKYFTDSADLGNVDAMLMLASMYRGSKGVPENPWLIFKWYSRAAECGSSTGYLHLGICAFNGTGTEKNLKRAMEYVRIAEKMGNSEAKMLLKRMERYAKEEEIENG